MKRKLVLLFLFLSVFLVAKEDVFSIKAPFKKATIYLESKGSSTKGKETIFIKNQGEYMATYTEMETKVFGVSNKEKTIEIITPEWIYNFDLNKNTGSKSHNPKVYMKEEYEKLSSSDKKKFEKNIKDISFNMMKAFNGNLIENAIKIFGYDCDKIEMMGSEIYYIHNTNITLKSKTNIMGMKTEMSAVRFDKENVDESKFELPKGIIPEYNEQADQMAKQMAINFVHSVVEGKEENNSQDQKDAEDLEKESEKRQKEEDKSVEKVLKGLFGN